MAHPGVVLDQLLARKRMSGFACGYAVTILVSAGGWTRILVGRPGLEPGTTGLKVL